MVENKNPLLEGVVYNNHTFIIPHNIDKEQLLNTIPSILKDMVLLLSQKHIDTPVNCILNVLITKLAQMITSKRVQYKDVYELGFPNWYSIIFVSSGIGKDYIVKDIDNLIFKNFDLWFDNKVEFYKRQEGKLIEEKANKEFGKPNEEQKKNAFIQAEKAKIRNIFKEVTGGTQEGFYSDAEAFSVANFGSIFLKIAEFGNYLKVQTTESMLYLNCLFEAYDGIIRSKSIKGENRKPDIKNMPVNAMLYASFKDFCEGKVKKDFNDIMERGICRRSVISFRPPVNLVCKTLTTKETLELVQNLETLGESLFKRFNSINDNSIFILESQAKDDVLNNYILYCKNEYNNTDDEILKLEINSRAYKALKLSCLYACLNHPTQLNITPEDLQQAIITIEALSTDLEKFANFKPKHNDKYDHLFLYFKKHIGEKITKTELKTKVFKEVDISRADMRENFDSIIESITEIAQVSGYYLINEQGQNNLQTYCLMPIQDKKNELEELLNKS